MPRQRPASSFIGTAGGALVTYSFTLGATSAGYWTFARQRVLDAGSSDTWSVGFWITIGLFGLLGGSAGTLANRIGLRRALGFWGSFGPVPSAPSPFRG